MFNICLAGTELLRALVQAFSYMAMSTFAVFEGRVFVGAEERPFEEVEGEDEEKGGGDPIATHQHEQSLLVDAERPCLFPKLSEGAKGGLILELLRMQAFCSYEVLLHLVVNYKSWNWKGRSCSISAMHQYNATIIQSCNKI